MSETPRALDGVRVLELAAEPGMYCGKLLADMGADVVLVEPPGGAPTRRIGPFFQPAPGSPAASIEEHDRSPFFWHYNTNKRSVVLDLARADDLERFRQLARHADVVLEAMPPGAMERIGLGYAALAAENPRLTVVSITPFGQTGPHRHLRGSDLVCQAIGGMVYVNGSRGRAPLQGYGLQAYHAASLHAATGALLALWARERSGRGQWVDVSIQECVAACVEHAASLFHQNGSIAERQGSLHWTRHFRVARCLDGYALHCTLGDWTTLIEWVKGDGKAQELSDPEWEDFQYRRAHCVRLFDVLDDWARGYRVADLVAAAQLRRLPYAAVVPLESLPENPQLEARRFFVPVPHPELGATVSYPGAPYVFGRTPWRLRRRPPRLGEHTAEVFAELSGQAPSGEAGNASGAPEGRPASPSRALAGVRVIDFTWVVAGPLATRILADHGAEVIKIERRDAADFGSRRSGLTGNLNRGKQSLVLDMNTAAGVDLARRLVATADVVIDNFSARVMRNWGLDYDNLRRIKPDIIAVSMSGFGHSGPWRDYVSYGPTLQALSGHTLRMRHAGAEPDGWGFSYSDMAAGCSAALAVLLALHARRLRGTGQHVDLSQFENLVALSGPELLRVGLAAAAAADPAGAALDNRSQEVPSAPHGVYRCADLPGADAGRERWCAIVVRDDEDWARLCRAAGDPPWSRDPRFASPAARLAHADALDACIGEWTRRRGAEEVMDRVQNAGVAAGVVADAANLCREDAHLQARGYWAQVETPEREQVVYDGSPVRLSATPAHVARPAPLLGEHGPAVLERLLGSSAAEIAALRDNNVIR